jgi:hypothetical protein
MINKTWFTLGVVTLSSLSVLRPSTVFAQHGPGRHGAGSVEQKHGPGPHDSPAYDANSETTFKGTVADVKTGRSSVDWLFRIHTMGLGRTRVQEKQILLKTDTGTVEIRLGPIVFLTEKNVEIRKGDSLEVTGSRVTIADSEAVLAREIRKGDNTWALRDVTGQPLWSSVETEGRRFWTTRKILLAAVVIKVVALATVIRH